jgi:16S rRNA (cytosine1402-N4)-methyltransferase
MASDQIDTKARRFVSHIGNLFCTEQHIMKGRAKAGVNAAGAQAFDVQPPHIPVLLSEVLAALQPQKGGIVLDGTFGAGGYSTALLEAGADHVVAIDRDPDALARGQALVEKWAGRLTLINGRFGAMQDVADQVGIQAFEGIVLDIGVSSMQIDEAERGFSFRFDGPLDMRMEREGRSAADYINHAPEAELANIFYHYGEERRSRAIARAIVAARLETPFTTTLQLAHLIAGVVWAEPHAMHPATRSFQALRIAVNDELGELVRALHAAEQLLKPGGRLVVVTFHSLEDRIVKQFMAARTGKMAEASRHMPISAGAAPSFARVGKGFITPSEEEIRLNPRARSAKLRVMERLNAPAQKALEALNLLSQLPPSTSHKKGRR